MGRFKTRSRASRPGRAAARGELPPRLEAAGEALASDPGCRRDDTREACAVAGRVLASDGVPLTDALDALRATTRAVLRRDPAYAAVRALGSGWSEATLGYLGEVTCEDPLTGLASLPHLRSRVAELYRDEVAGGSAVCDHQVLVVLETPQPPVFEDASGEAFGSALRTARLADTVRAVFPAGLTVGRVSRERVVALVRRDARLDRRLALLAALTAGVRPAVRIWSEALPTDERGAADLLGALATPEPL